MMVVLSITFMTVFPVGGILFFNRHKNSTLLKDKETKKLYGHLWDGLKMNGNYLLCLNYFH